MKKPLLWMLLVVFALSPLSCGPKGKYYGRPGPANDVYVMDSQTNTIEGYLILPDEWGGIGLPGRLYEEEEFGYAGNLYDVAEELAKRYNFPISWDPEPIPEERSNADGSLWGKYNFYTNFRGIVFMASEMDYLKPRAEPYDPNVTSVGIIKKDGAVIKRVRRATHFKKM